MAITSREAAYLKALEEAEEAFKKIHQDPSDWKSSKTTKHVKVWSKRSTLFPGYMHRIECIVNASLEEAYERYMPSPLGSRLEWDKTIQLHELLQTLEEGTFMYRAITHSQLMGLIAAREFVYLLKVTRQLEDNYIMTSCISIDHPSYPAKDNPVRGRNYPCGTYFTVLPENQVKITNYYHVDLGGRLPQSVIDSSIPQIMASTMELYYKAVQGGKK
ncbi:stAR-related lipid transfer protein 5-like [Diadema setosum]|uniref:stAR-related lipid transfer protein 5-like n=1 Tax=Diadema setosum TaxID=31175 RepID=UPI003B3A6B51